MAQRDAPARNAAVAKLRATSSAAVVGLGLVAVKVVTGRGFSCPFRALTGWRCPFCGATTMGVDLVGGRLVDAWHQNQVCVAGLVGLLACCAWWAVVAAGIAAPAAWPGPARRLAGYRLPMAGRGAAGSQRRLYLAAGAVALTWTLVRNTVPALRTP